ncbi:DNA-directed RNA polymerase iii largest subunit [Trichosporon asahii var. asahii CBS 2479]|uniref:DNA-directed RNA polymerase subunit n=1 Tax=Trichosporon asahii var. asahii (strain ATCC 90039 / CBS 2479 / JCM 2466 / KCTC 7840 / NBRC 103889/ NCYC 2677 / UAMH 7654) TaxID=1186058 RepID=J6EQR1_TRIAS|nr:DNA-directed RNA polymerase iii largest subunit [Trichosporon asahii var. asahii CBS 2479]EJT46834.1 DNA-directed RNA polymerase iii largest subunit [Trichosporon asahii var. asahii CBS 2479]
MDAEEYIDHNAKEYVSQDAPKRIKQIQFQPFAPKDIVRVAEVEVTIPELYKNHDDGTRTTAPQGPLDAAMVSYTPLQALMCRDPTRRAAHVPPVTRTTRTVWDTTATSSLPSPSSTLATSAPQLTCCSASTCARVLLPPEERASYLKRFRRPRIEMLQRQAASKGVLASCKKVTTCPYCFAPNGIVKKSGTLKISHEPFRSNKNADAKAEWLNGFKAVVSEQSAIGSHLGKSVEDLNPLKVLELFRRVTAEDCELLSLHPDVGRPEDYLWTYISVPPPCIRPSVASEAGNNEDDLTAKLVEIVNQNRMLLSVMEKGQGLTQTILNWDTLSQMVALYINSQTPGINTTGSKPIRGFVQRLKGKQGRFRGNLSGKRVDFSGRTVIGPDPNLRIDEVAVPEKIAVKLSYPERVTDYNMEAMRKAVVNGSKMHPGANIIETGRGPFPRRSLQPIKDIERRKEMARNLRVGDIVHRHVRDGDIVLFNRQPSLHKISIMCHRVRVRPWRTFRLNECVCNPYNADFDGDEMNLHRGSSYRGSGAHDFITASYLLSRRDRLLDRQQFTQICSYLGDGDLEIDLPPPTIWKPVRLWTGKQVYNLLMRPNKKSKVLINLEAKCRTLIEPRKEDKFFMDMAPNDGYLVIQNSEIMCGVFDKNTVGDGKKNSVFGVMLRDYGPNEAAIAMTRLAKLSARWLANQGFSLGINDVIPGEMLQSNKDQMVEEAYEKCESNIELAKRGKLQNAPGCDQETTLEQLISGILSGVREAVGDVCMNELSRHNAPLIMATCGSKVGQQIIAGHRVPNGFQDRSLPHFRKKSKNPPSKGFVRNSFFSGLTPTEFLFHAISGREGLVDTAVKTAETGYMARRLMKALEDLSTQYDLSVRNSVGGIVQFQYGDDNLDPACLEGDATPVEYVRSWNHACRTASSEGRPLYPYEIQQIARRIYPEIVAEEYAEEDVKPRRGQKRKAPPTIPEVPVEWRQVHVKFRENTYKFIVDKIVNTMAAQREARGVPAALTKEEIEEYEDFLDPHDPAVRAVLNNSHKVTEAQIESFLENCRTRYLLAKIEPGSTVGAVGAQSIGEPGTQMTLKTFHFAGVASMNVTLGVPRIKEIINAAKVISTPIITVELQKPESEPVARIVKGRIERTTLGEIASIIEEAWTGAGAFIEIHIDMDAIQKLQLEITLDTIKTALVLAPKLKIKDSDVTINSRKARLKIYVADPLDKDKCDGVYERLKSLKRAIPSVQVKGLPEVDRSVITHDEKKKGEYKLLVTGYGLQEVMGTDGVNGYQTRTNHVMETAKVLGIEAARQTIYDEIQHTMRSHGMSIDPRHVMLLGDVMTYKGEVLGITRFGVQKMKDSVLMLASFEKTTDHLFDASLYSKVDDIQGVSECIIMGTPAPSCGTSLASIVTPPPFLPKRKPLIFEEAYRAGRERRAANMDVDM